MRSWARWSRRSTRCPSPRSFPVTVLWLGFGDGSKILLIFLGCMLPVTLGAYNGARSCEQHLVWSARSLGASRLRVLLRRGAAERAARAAERHPQRARALLRAAGVLRADRRARGPRLSHRLPRRRRHVRRHVRGGAGGGVPRFLRRPRSTSASPTGCSHGATDAAPRAVDLDPGARARLGGVRAQRRGDAFHAAEAHHRAARACGRTAPPASCGRTSGWTLYRSLAGFAIATVAGPGARLCRGLQPRRCAGCSTR